MKRVEDVGHELKLIRIRRSQPGDRIREWPEARRIVPSQVRGGGGHDLVDGGPLGSVRARQSPQA
jgi:hypothetical protein